MDVQGGVSISRMLSFGSFYNSRLSYRYIESGHLLCRFGLSSLIRYISLSFLNLNEMEASGNLWMAWLIFRWGPTRDMQQWIINGVDFSAIPSKNEYENLRAHNFVDLALICTILGSTDIYSE